MGKVKVSVQVMATSSHLWLSQGALHQHWLELSKLNYFLFIYIVISPRLSEKLFQNKFCHLHQIHKYPLASIFCLLSLKVPPHSNSKSIPLSCCKKTHLCEEKSCCVTMNFRYQLEAISQSESSLHKNYMRVTNQRNKDFLDYWVPP